MARLITWLIMVTILLLLLLLHVLQSSTDQLARLTQAINDEDEPCIALLLQDDSVRRIVEGSDDFLLQACMARKWKSVSLLLELTSVDPGTNESLPFRLACEAGEHQLVTALLKNSRVNPVADDGTGLLWACENGHEQVVRAILGSNRFEMEKRDAKALDYAISGRHIGVCALLVVDGRILQSIDHERKIKLLDILALDVHIEAFNALIRQDIPPDVLQNCYYRIMKWENSQLVANRLLIEPCVFYETGGQDYDRFIQELDENPETSPLLFMSECQYLSKAQGILKDAIVDSNLHLLFYCLRHGIYTELFAYFAWGLALDGSFKSIHDELNGYLEGRLLLMPRSDAKQPILLSMAEGDWSTWRWIPFINLLSPIKFIQIIDR